MNKESWSGSERDALNLNYLIIRNVKVNSS
jgi:hypothetical protein